MQKKYLIFVLIISLSLYGCNSQFTSEKEIVKAVEAGKLEKVHQFITENLDTTGEKDLLYFAIEQILHAKKEESKQFLKDTYEDLIKREREEELKNLARPMDNYLESALNMDSNQFILIRDQIFQYEKANQELPSLRDEFDALNDRKNQLRMDFPYPKLLANDQKPETISGVITQKIDGHTYRAHQNFTNTSFVLVTATTEFTSSGSFQLTVIYEGNQSFPMQNGFNETFPVFHEVTPEMEATINELNTIEEDLAELNPQIEQLEFLVDNHSDTLTASFDFMIEQIFDHESPSEDDSEADEIDEKPAEEKGKHEDSNKDEASKKDEVSMKDELIDVKDNKLYYHSITLGDSKEDVLDKWGSPIEDRIDEGTMEHVLEYKDSMAYYNENGVFLIYFETNFNEMKNYFTKETAVDRYISEDGAMYLHDPNSDHLIHFTKGENEKASVYLDHADGNFFYYIEDGYIQPYKSDSSEKLSLDEMRTKAKEYVDNWNGEDNTLLEEDWTDDAKQSRYYLFKDGPTDHMVGVTVDAHTGKVTGDYGGIE